MDSQEAGNQHNVTIGNLELKKPGGFYLVGPVFIWNKSIHSRRASVSACGVGIVPIKQASQCGLLYHKHGGL
jgi:hypothetical protein